jgi:AAA15 family ATPase/GTPase
VQEAMPEYFASEGEHVIPGAYRIKTLHMIYDAAGQPSGSAVFDLDRQESEGTRKLFALSGPLLAALASGTPFVADEFDARLHPIMTRKLVELFNSRQTNPRGAQLNRLFRRDQIWFTEKDRQGATHLYSLAEFRGVRNDASFRKDYIKGRYGAIPFLGDLGRLGGNGDA